MTPEFKTLCEAFEALAKKLDSRLTRMEMHFGLAIDTDPAIGHPELPLAEQADDEDEADIRWAATGTDDDRPTVPVEVGAYYFTRNGTPARVTRPQCDYFHGQLRLDGKWLSYNWNADGSSFTGIRSLDIVEAAPF